MRKFEDHHPLVLAVYFCSILLVSMFSQHPYVLILSLLGAVSLLFSRRTRLSGRTILFFLILFFLSSLLNPLMNHRGETILFVLNRNPVTLEALLYGMTSGLMILTACLWFVSVTEILTSDRLLYLFGTVSPKLALMLSLALRLIPLYGKKRAQIADTQKALGLFKEDNAMDEIRGQSRVFSVMVTWALENGIVTADSMASRGYGSGRRTSFSVFRLRKSDGWLIAGEILLTGVIIAALITDSLTVTFYPTVVFNEPGILTYLGLTALGLLSILPALLTLSEEVRWKFLQSKI